MLRPVMNWYIFYDFGDSHRSTKNSNLQCAGRPSTVPQFFFCSAIDIRPQGHLMARLFWTTIFWTARLKRTFCFLWAAAQDFHLEIMDTSWYIMSTSWFVSFRVFLMELFVHWNQCRYNSPSWDPLSPRHTPRSRMWNHLMFLKYMNMYI